MLSSEPCI